MGIFDKERLPKFSWPTEIDLEAIRARDAAWRFGVDIPSEKPSQMYRDRRDLIAYVDALRKDAERYRFIKRWVRRLDIVGYSLTCNEHFEPRIDEAMEQSHE